MQSATVLDSAMFVHVALTVPRGATAEPKAIRSHIRHNDEKRVNSLHRTGGKYLHLLDSVLVV